MKFSAGVQVLSRYLSIRGAVSPGKGEGSIFVSLEWVRRQIEEKLGFIPYPGTLNLRLLPKDAEKRSLLEKTEKIWISPAAGFNRGKCFRATLADNLGCAIVLPENQDYPPDIIEVVAPLNLREKLQLKDGDHVDIRVRL